MYKIPDTTQGQLRARIELEQSIVTMLVKNALAAGYSLSVDDGGEEWAIERSTDEAAILDALCNTDEDKLVYHAPQPVRETPLRSGKVLLVYGNDGYDVIADYSTALETHIRPVLNHCDKLSEAA